MGDCGVVGSANFSEDLGWRGRPPRPAASSLTLSHTHSTRSGRQTALFSSVLIGESHFTLDTEKNYSLPLPFPLHTLLPHLTHAHSNLPARRHRALSTSFFKTPSVANSFLPPPIVIYQHAQRSSYQGLQARLCQV